MFAPARRRFAVLFIMLALGALVSCASASADVPPDFFGVNAQYVFARPSDTWGPQLAAMRQVGITVVRRDASWDCAEPTPPDASGHHYNWQCFDAEVGALAQYGLRFYPILDYSAPWASSIPGNPFAPPANASDYIDYAVAFAQRYGRGGEFWREHPELPQLPVTNYEIWNEPDFSMFWQPQTGAADRYIDLYLATRAALHQVDPQATAVVGGLLDFGNEDFVNEMFQHRPDARGQVDAIGFHPYWDDAGSIEQRIRDLRQTLAGLGEGGVPIEITEVGWSVTTPAGETARAQALYQLATDLPKLGLGVTRLIPHTWITQESDPSDMQQWFGINNLDGSMKPTSAAYQRAIHDALNAPNISAATTPRAARKHVAVRIGRQPLRRVLRRGLSVRLSGVAGTTARIEVFLRRGLAARFKIHGAAQPKPVLIGQASRLIGVAKRSTKIFVELLRRVRRRLTDVKSLTLTIRVSLTDASGWSKIVQRKIVL